MAPESPALVVPSGMPSPNIELDPVRARVDADPAEHHRSSTPSRCGSRRRHVDADACNDRDASRSRPRQVPTRADKLLAVTLALLLHALALLTFWLARAWEANDDLAAAGPVVAATLQFNDTDVRAAQAALAQAKAALPT